MNVATIEFIGGPLDGYDYRASLPDEGLGDVVALPINQNVVRMLNGEGRGEVTGPSSVALYELDRQDEALRYQFVVAGAPTEFELMGWKV